MKIKYLYLLILFCAGALQACNDGYEAYNGVYVSGTLTNNPMISLTVDDNFPKEVELTVASSELVTRDVTVEMRIDSNLVAKYNKKFQTNYHPLPEKCSVLSHPTVNISTGNYATSAPVKLSIISTDGMVQGRKYMVPVTITHVSGGYPVIEASRTVYVVLNQVIVASALKLGSTNLKIDFMQGHSDDYDPFDLAEFSFEARVMMYGYGQFNTIMGLEENIILRTSTYNNGGGKLELTGDGMNNVTSPSPFPLNAWTHVAVTYSSFTKIAALYINGDQVASLAVNRKNPHICLKGAYEGSGQQPDAPFRIGYSAGGRTLNGAVSEARVWAKSLTAAEVKNNMCAVDPTTKGLLAYWKFNENATVSEFTDLTGNGFTPVAQGSYSWIPGVRCPE